MKWVAPRRSAIVCHKPFILSPDIDIILQEKFATAIVPESEALCTRRAYERVAKMILFSCTTSEQQ